MIVKKATFVCPQEEATLLVDPGGIHNPVGQSLFLSEDSSPCCPPKQTKSCSECLCGPSTQGKYRT